ncbi:MAG: VOC family protein [Pseudomonadota bacterium]
MSAPLGRIIIYTKKIDEMAAFYARHFGYSVHRDPEDRLVALEPPGAGAALYLHPAGQRQKDGQVMVKLVFDVEDVDAFCAEAAKAGLTFARPFKADGYTFANAKDPAGNSISVSSRAFRGRI